MQTLAGLASYPAVANSPGSTAAVHWRHIDKWMIYVTPVAEFSCPSTTLEWGCCCCFFTDCVTPKTRLVMSHG